MSDRLEQLELQIERLTELADPTRGPATHFFLRHNATRDQESAVYKLLDFITRDAKVGKKPGAASFEAEIRKIFSEGQAHFLAVEIVDAFGKLDGFREGIEALKQTKWFS